MLALIVTSVLFGAAFAQECDTIQTDECAVKMLPFLLDSSKIPSNEAELEELCKDLHDGETCIRDFVSRCPNLLKKEVSDPMLEAWFSTVKDMCTGSLGKRLLPHGACLKQNVGDGLSTCNADTIKLAEAVAVSEPASDRLKHLCCTYFRLDKCLADASHGACEERASRTVRNILQSVALFMVDKCLPTLSAPETCTLDVFKDAEPSARNPKTFIPGLMDILAATM